MRKLSSQDSSGSDTSLTLADGYGTNALFNYPSGLVIYNDSTLYISDTNNYCVRAVDISSGKIPFF